MDLNSRDMSMDRLEKSFSRSLRDLSLSLLGNFKFLFRDLVTGCAEDLPPNLRRCPCSETHAGGAFESASSVPYKSAFYICNLYYIFA